MEPVKQFVRKVLRRAWNVNARSATPYATHIPVLVACAHLFKPARILELGSGNYSTPLFLDRLIFPDVVSVRSLENDQSWFESLNHLNDPRLERVLVPGTIAESLEPMDISGFDLIFVDDSDVPGRKKTLACLRKKLGSQVVVVHDYELPHLRLAVYRYPKHQGMAALNPQCSVAWDKRPIERKALAKCDAIIRANAGQIGDVDALRWRNKFVE